MKTFLGQNVADLKNHSFKIGDNVIVVSNNDTAKIGTYLGTQKITKAEKDCPLVEIEGYPFLCMGIIIPYSNEAINFLQKLETWEQWNSLCLETNEMKCPYPKIKMNNDLFKQLEDVMNEMSAHLCDKHTKIPDKDRTPEFENMLSQFQWVERHFGEFKTSFFKCQQKE